MEGAENEVWTEEDEAMWEKDEMVWHQTLQRCPVRCNSWTRKSSRNFTVQLSSQASDPMPEELVEDLLEDFSSIERLARDLPPTELKNLVHAWCLRWHAVSKVTNVGRSKTLVLHNYMYYSTPRGALSPLRSGIRVSCARLPPLRRNSFGRPWASFTARRRVP